MVLFSVEANPMHSLIILAIITYPPMTRLSNKELKKIGGEDISKE